jgi:hypothetical protein
MAKNPLRRKLRAEQTSLYIFVQLYLSCKYFIWRSRSSFWRCRYTGIADCFCRMPACGVYSIPVLTTRCDDIVDFSGLSLPWKCHWSDPKMFGCNLCRNISRGSHVICFFIQSNIVQQTLTFINMHTSSFYVMLLQYLLINVPTCLCRRFDSGWQSHPDHFLITLS